MFSGHKGHLSLVHDTLACLIIYNLSFASADLKTKPGAFRPNVQRLQGACIGYFPTEYIPLFSSSPARGQRLSRVKLV